MNERTAERVHDFLSDLEELMRGYQISIVHENSQGAFILVDFDEDYLQQLKDANIKLKGAND